jgi:3-deoxy-D-manno-octulosonate 8-phosphate phosphatase (KDO 8-P phosphatase)
VKQIKAVALDVDGVLTDGTFWWGPDGQEWKRFSFADVMGVSLGRKAGLVFALISGEDSPLIDRYAQKMGIRDVFKGCKDKGTAFQTFVARYNIPLSQACFMGDDINDLSAMRLAGFSAAPANAQPSVRAFVAMVAANPGGRGAVRELIEQILRSRSECDVLPEDDRPQP